VVRLFRLIVGGCFGCPDITPRWPLEACELLSSQMGFVAGRIASGAWPVGRVTWRGSDSERHDALLGGTGPEAPVLSASKAVALVLGRW
jgi:hypothetical protein